VTVRAAECGGAHSGMQCMRQCASVRLVVYSSARERQCAAVQQCSSLMLQCGSVSAAVRQYERQYVWQ
jgi:hypothetical protein